MNKAGESTHIPSPIQGSARVRTCRACSHPASPCAQTGTERCLTCTPCRRTSAPAFTSTRNPPYPQLSPFPPWEIHKTTTTLLPNIRFWVKFT